MQQWVPGDWEVVLPYSPPCDAGDLQLGNYCYKQPHVLIPIPLANSFNMTIGGLDAELLPMVASAIGPESHMIVQKSGDAVDLTLTSLQREHVDAINEKLGITLP